jgi:DHA1 family bicyclomycin/chloramphenicol resistance-like MFS transporter
MSDAQNRPRAVWLDPRTPPHIATLVALCGIAALNMNVFLPSLPQMAADFDADYAVIQLAVSAYLAVTAVLQLAIGPLSDRYGRRPVMLGCVGVFVAATVGCVLAPNVWVFLACRMVQAVVASCFTLSRAVVRDMVGPADSAAMIGYVTMGMSIAPMIGPAVGGAVDAAFGWRATVGGMALCGLGVLWLAWRDLGETRAARPPGAPSAMRGYPELMRSGRFWTYTLIAAAASGSFFAFLGGAPYVASVTLGLGPAETGFWFASVALGYAAGNYLSGRYAARVGLYGMMLAGAVTAMGGLLSACALHALGVLHPAALFGPILLLGLGNGLTLPSANAGMLSVRPELAGGASGLGGALMIGGGAALSAITGALLGPETGAAPLLAMMTASAAVALAASLSAPRLPA